MFLRAVDDDVYADDIDIESEAEHQPEPIEEAPELQVKTITIPSEMKVIGKVVVKGDLEIQGEVEGDVVSNSVIVGEDATVTGEVCAHNVEVRGCVSGMIRAQKLLLANSCFIQGDIFHNSLSIETGAILDGQCWRSDRPMEAQKP